MPTTRPLPRPDRLRGGLRRRTAAAVALPAVLVALLAGCAGEQAGGPDDATSGPTASGDGTTTLPTVPGTAPQAGPTLGPEAGVPAPGAPVPGAPGAPGTDPAAPGGAPGVDLPPEEIPADAIVLPPPPPDEQWVQSDGTDRAALDAEMAGVLTEIGVPGDPAGQAAGLAYILCSELRAGTSVEETQAFLGDTYLVADPAPLPRAIATAQRYCVDTAG